MNVPTRQLTRDAVFKRVARLLHEIAGLPTEVINEDATIDGELQMNSVIFVELQVSIEDELETELDPIVIVETNRLGDIVDYIYQCVSGVNP